MIMSYLTRITQQKVLTEMKTKYYVLNKQSLKLPGNGQLHSTVYPEILLHWVDCSYAEVHKSPPLQECSIL